MNACKVVLVVAAHPDDEVLGAAATVAKLKREGWRAILMLMTRGVTGRAETDAAIAAAHRKAQETLAAETRRAADLVGYDRIVSLDFPDNRMDQVARADIAHAIGAVVQEERPTLVLTHHPGDYNWDHGVTFDAVLMGARSTPGEFGPDEIWCFEVLSSSERGWRGKANPFNPIVYVDVAATIDVKRQALEAYASEIHDAPHPRSSDGVMTLARKRGHEVGLAFAECFDVVRKIVR